MQFHGALNGFRSDRGTGTASLKSKLLRQLMSIKEEVVYEFFLDLWKSYDALDQERFVYILMGYGVGLWMEGILRYYCDHLSMVSRSGAITAHFSRDTEGSLSGIPYPPPYLTWWSTK